MQNDGLIKKRKILEEQLTQLRKTAKLGMLTPREFSVAEKRISRQLEETALTLRLRDTKKKVVKELLKKKRADEEGISFEQLQHLKVKDLKKKTEHVNVKKTLAKKERAKEILAALEKPKEKMILKETTLNIKENLIEPEKKHLIIDDKKEQRAALVQEILKESTVQQLPPFQIQDDTLDPTTGWKMAFVVFGLLLIVLLYLKFSSPLTTTPLEVTLYSDYTCATCAEVYDIFTELQEIYGKQFIVKHVTLARDEQGFLAGAAAECAADQGKFLPYHEMLYSTLPELEQQISETTIINFAEELQLDVPLFTKCLQSDIKIPLLEKHKREALQQGIDAVPTVVLGNRKKLVGLFSKETYIKEINTILGVTGGSSGLADVTTITEAEQ